MLNIFFVEIQCEKNWASIIERVGKKVSNLNKLSELITRNDVRFRHWIRISSVVDVSRIITPVAR